MDLPGNAGSLTPLTLASSSGSRTEARSTPWPRLTRDRSNGVQMRAGGRKSDSGDCRLRKKKREVVDVVESGVYLYTSCTLCQVRIKCLHEVLALTFADLRPLPRLVASPIQFSRQERHISVAAGAKHIDYAVPLRIFSTPNVISSTISEDLYECLLRWAFMSLSGPRKMATQLPHLPDVEQLSTNVIRILGGNPNKVRRDSAHPWRPSEILSVPLTDQDVSFSSRFKVSPISTQMSISSIDGL
jgi:hypothetical protein